jgi:hypothetical protein
MNKRTILLACASVLSFAVFCLAADPAVIQPNSSEWSAAEQTQLATAIATLEPLLANVRLGSQLTLGSWGWTSQEFSRFCAWTLADRGYSVILATSASWGGQTHTWVLVGVSLGGRTAWIPVEATPSTGMIQTTLGKIPFQSRTPMYYDDRYVAFTSSSGLPHNSAPVARIESSTRSVGDSDLVTLSAHGATDPDGHLSIYVWCVERLLCEATTSWSYALPRAAQGELLIQLTVIDNLGRPGRTEIILQSNGEAESASEERPKSDCGCG